MISEKKLNRIFVSNFSDFKSWIINFNQVYQKCQTIKSLTENSPKTIVKKILSDKLLSALDKIDYCDFLGSEYKILKIKGKGRRPSIDILSCNPHRGVFHIIELKVENVAERNLITELSGYSQGILNRYWGLSKKNIVWIPISPEWRTTVRASVQFQFFYNNLSIIPLNLIADKCKNKSVELTIIDDITDLPIEVIISTLILTSYDCIEIYFTNEVHQSQIIQNIISHLYSKYNFNGFSIYSDPKDYDVQYPFGLTIGVFNPYKARINQEMLRKINSDTKSSHFAEIARSGFSQPFDIDLLTDKIIEPSTGYDKSALSFALCENSPSGNEMVIEIRSLLEKYFGRGGFTTSTPDMSLLVEEDYFIERRNKKVNYFGFLNDYFFEKVKIDSDLKLLQPYSNNPLIALSSFEHFLLSFNMK